MSYCIVSNNYANAKGYGYIDTENIDLQKYAGDTALMLAVKYKSKRAFNRLISCGADVNISRSRWYTFTALSYVPENDWFIRELLLEGASFDCKYGDMALEKAVENNFFDEIKCSENILFERKGFEFNTAIIIAFERCKDTRILDALLVNSQKISLNVSLLRTNSTLLIKKLISAGADVNAHNDVGDTALHKAVTDQNIESVKLLVKSRANIEAVDNNGFTAFLVSILLPSTDIMEYLISCGVNLKCINYSGKTPMHIAVMHGTLRCIEILSSKGLNVLDVTFMGKNALHFAMERNDTDIIKFCINKGVNVNIPIPEYTPLMIAAYRQNDVVAKQLIDQGANIHFRNNLEDSALNVALDRGSEDIALLLVQLGADVNKEGATGILPLFMAIENFSAPLTINIIKSGAEVNKIDEKGRTAVIQALVRKRLPTNFGPDERSVYTGRTDIVVQLLESRADLNIPVRENITPLLLAIWFNDLHFVKLFIEHGANVNFANADIGENIHDTNTSIKCELDNKLDSILQNTCKKNALHISYTSMCILYVALHLAIKLERDDIFHVLLEAGADVYQTDVHGNSAIHYAAQCENKNLLHHLLTNYYPSPLTLSASVNELHAETLKVDSLVPLKDQTTKVQTDLLTEPVGLINTKAPKTAFPEPLPEFQGSMNIPNSKRARLESSTETEGLTDEPQTKQMRLDTLCKPDLHKGESEEKLLNKELLVKHIKLIDEPRINQRKHQCSLNSLNVINASALHFAAHYNRIENVKMLIEAGCDLDILTETKETALLIALSKGFDEIGEILLKAGANISFTNENNESLFQISVKNGCLNSFNFLVHAGVNIYETNKDGASALHYMPREEIAKSLIDLGLDVNQSDKFGRSPIHIATKKQKLKMIRFLHTFGADINKQDLNGNTILMVSSKMFQVSCPRNKHIFQEILRFCPNIDLQDSLGCTALMYLINSDSYVCEEISVLLANNAGVNMKDQEGRSALVYLLSSKKSQPPDVKLLLKHGADPFLGELHRNTLINWIQTDHYTRQSLFLNDDEFLRLYLCNGITMDAGTYFTRSSALKYWSVRQQWSTMKYLFASSGLKLLDLQYIRGKDLETSPSHFNSNNSDPVDHDLLTQARCQPWPLVKLAFITVSTLLGDFSDRPNKVKQTSLPGKLQQLLLFQTPVARLPVSEWPHIRLCFDPDEYDKLPNPRPFIYFWPFGKKFL